MIDFVQKMYQPVCPKNLNIDICSDTMATAAMKLGTMVLFGKSFRPYHFEWPSSKVTATGADEKNLEKLKHWHFLRHHDHYSLESWHNNTVWQGPSDHTSLSALYPRSGPQGLMEKSWKTETLAFSQTLWPLQAWNLAQLYFLARPFKSCQFGWPLSRSWPQGLMENLDKNQTLMIFQMLWPLQSRNVAQRHFMAWPLRPFQLLWPSAKVTITRVDGKCRKTLAFSQTLSSLQS